ncbi:ankyrin repeat domain-containing protein [Andreprevotia chitinilytica]|uniref:ankyrin repeat domain-containing protein n=1 Tax=Andreprevotia chitinilytica TaxID=396808 RepID=UPI00068C7E42|nr:ankyrin repeat domain-containing protein [Andreprevotia chitinilytica]
MDRFVIEEQLRQCLGAYQEHFPQELVAHYPRIASQIIDLWGSRNLDMYFEELMIDSRGDRQGFPSSVAHELLGLMRVYDLQRDIRPDGMPDIWGHTEQEHLEFREARPKFTSITLIEAAQKGELERFEAMVKTGINCDRADELGKSALIWASAYGHTPIVERLIELAAEVHRVDLGGYQAIHWAAANGHVDTLNCLINHGAHINAQNKRGYTPLMLAAQGVKLGTVSRLLEAGADPNLVDEESNNVLHQVLLYGRPGETIPILTLLLEYKADVQRSNRQRQTPLIIAMAHTELAVRTLFSRHTGDS